MTGNYEENSFKGKMAKHFADSNLSPVFKEISRSLIGNNSNSVSFGGTVYTVDDLTDAYNKVERAKREVKKYQDFLESDIRFNRDTSMNTLNLRHAQDALDRAVRDYERIKSKVKG